MNLEYYLMDKLKKIADDVVISVNNGEASQLKFVNNKFVKTGVENLSIITIFCAKDKKIIFTSLKDVGKKEADETVAKIIKNLKFVKPSEDYYGIADGPFKYKNINDVYDKKVNDIDDVDYCLKGVNAALKNSKRVSGIFEKWVTNNTLITNKNVEASEKGTNLYFSIRAFNEKDESGHMNCASRILSKFDVEGAGRKAGEIAKQAKNPVEGVEGKYDVVWDEMSFAALLNPIMEAASVFNVEAGMSFYADKIGRKLGNFDLIDDGSLENGYGSALYDEEGVPTERTSVVKDGILKTYLHNTSTARKCKVKTTGNAGLIVPMPHNIIFDGKKGNVFGIDKGIYITNIWYTRFNNYATGDFSTIPRDGIFLIKNGEINGAIKNIRVSDNMLNLLKNVELVSKEKNFLKGWEAQIPCYTPKVLIRDVNITKPTI